MTDPSLEVIASRRCLVAKIGGEMDWVTQPVFREWLLELFAKESRAIVLDLSGVPFCDSAGLGVLIWARRQAEERAAVLALVCVPPQVRQLLAMTGADQFLCLYDTVADAETAFGG